MGIFRALVTAVLSIVMLVDGGVATVAYVTLIFALAVAISADLVMTSFFKALCSLEALLAARGGMI